MFLTFLAWRRGPQIDLGSYGEPRRAYVAYAQNMTIGKLTMQQLHILHCTFRFYKYTNKYQLCALKYALLRTSTDVVRDEIAWWAYKPEHATAWSWNKSVGQNGGRGIVIISIIVIEKMCRLTSVWRIQLVGYIFVSLDVSIFILRVNLLVQAVLKRISPCLKFKNRL